MTLPEPYRWLGDPKTAMIACVIPMVWAGMGPGCLIYLAALKGIADDYYEAADIDGATFIDKILFIVFPILKPLILHQLRRGLHRLLVRRHRQHPGHDRRGGQHRGGRPAHLLQGLHLT